MKKINFSYETKLTFDDYVHYHSFALRVIPPETETQHILNCELDISPISTTQQTVDAFGNNVTSGYLASQHRFLDFSIKGTAETDLSKFRTDYLPCIFWGRTAREMARLTVGARITMTGRLQSRDYVKTLADGQTEQRTAYEISAVTAELTRD